jgi:hypothetical protein
VAHQFFQLVGKQSVSFGNFEQFLSLGGRTRLLCEILATLGKPAIKHRAMRTEGRISIVSHGLDSNCDISHLNNQGGDQ